MEKWLGHVFSLTEDEEYRAFLEEAQKDIESMISGTGFHIIQVFSDFSLSVILRNETTGLEVCVTMADARTAGDAWYSKVLYYKYNIADTFKICKWTEIRDVLMRMEEQ